MCYRNTAVNWRNGQETRLEDVLQSEEIYENASHGLIAKTSDLNKYFAGKSKREIIEVILDRGELQVTDKEREAQSSQLFNDVASIVLEKCVHPTSLRQFPLDLLKEAIRDIRFPIRNDQPAKAQALHCIKALSRKYKIQRARMRIRVSANEPATLQRFLEKARLEGKAGERPEVEVEIDPGVFREVNQECKNFEAVRVDVLVNSIVNKSEVSLKEPPTLLEVREDWREEDSIFEEKEPERPEPKSKYFCKVCAEAQPDAREFREHYKGERHKHNQWLEGKSPPLSEEEFRAFLVEKHFKM